MQIYLESVSCPINRTQYNGDSVFLIYDYYFSGVTLQAEDWNGAP